MESSSLYHHDELLKAVHSLAGQFVTRQSVVLDAIRDLRPNWIIRAEGRIEKEFSKDEWQSFVQKCMHIPPDGYWGNNNEWEYFLHGIGCRLTHTTTGEPLEWDMGNLREFDKSWFVKHVQWKIMQEADSDAIIIKSCLSNEKRALEKLLGVVLDKLADTGILRPNQWKNKYLLVEV